MNYSENVIAHEFGHVLDNATGGRASQQYGIEVGKQLAPLLTPITLSNPKGDFTQQTIDELANGTGTIPFNYYSLLAAEKGLISGYAVYDKFNANPKDRILHNDAAEALAEAVATVTTSPSSATDTEEKGMIIINQELP
ncbi:MAG: hypothetical protein FWG25_00400 [Promicromonosporaceae bacterium]|nr:hypothetical protein [Promicromonosporaceae bacterium]